MPETPWHQDDDFWETFTDSMFDERRWALAPDEIAEVIDLLRVEPGAHVLDLACGVGRHSLALARLGFRVTGVDRTRHYLEQAAGRAAQEGLHVEFVREDMRTFVRPGAFDAAINLFTSFGYFEDPQDDRRVVQNVCHSLKPGGVFILDMMGKEVLARVFTPRDWVEENGTLFLQERTLSQNWGWIQSRWVLIEKGQRTEFTLGHRLYSATELIALFIDCGFAQADAYGDLDGSPYDHQARRLIVMGRKAPAG
jgi:SAM-dependent methyltransferase